MQVGGDESRAVVMVTDDGHEVVVWRVPDGVRADLSAIDTLGRLQLAARRMGWSIRLRNPCDDLRALLELVGLSDLFPDATDGQPDGPA